jgi:hypothetical protein
VNRAIPLLAGLIAALVVFVSSGAAASSRPQLLGFTLHRQAASTERLPHYRANAPISVHVTGKAAHLPAALLLTVNAPDGSAMQTPLVRHGDAFDGSLSLTTPGTWTVVLTSQLGTVTTALANVPLDVEAIDGADLAARIAYALSALSIAAGLALVVSVARRPRAREVTARS